MNNQYTIRRAHQLIDVNTPWDDPARSIAETATIANFRPESSEHRPRTQFRLLWEPERLHGMFRVEDHYVRAVSTEFGAPVCLDSCVELFIQPAAGAGYCNFEFNCIGTKLVSHVIDERRVGKKFANWRAWTAEEGDQVRVAASLNGPIVEELVGDLVWTLAFSIPFAPLLASTGGQPPESGAVWRANLYKCGDETSHPHWGSWNPIDAWNFHLPHCFGELAFE